MESKTEHASLIEVLSISRRTELGKKWDGKKLWLKAIVKVLKCDNSTNYALADNNGRNGASITRDFGNVAKIVKVEDIYPIYYLREEQKPNLKNKTEIIKYIASAGYNATEIESLLSDQDANGQEKDAEQKKADKEKVKNVINYIMIKTELANME